jgi:hypothetical protein
MTQQSRNGAFADAVAQGKLTLLGARTTVNQELLDRTLSKSLDDWPWSAFTGRRGLRLIGEGSDAELASPERYLIDVPIRRGLSSVL